MTITRVPGVVDLLTSGSSENEKEESDDDEETDLEFQAKTCDLPLTDDFTRRTWDSGSDSDDKSQSLLQRQRRVKCHLPAMLQSCIGSLC
jgi:hypothetical protein